MKFKTELIMQPNTVIHCNTKEKAKLLREAGFNINVETWDVYGIKTCYRTDNMNYGRKEYYDLEKYIVLEFEEVVEMTEIIAGVDKVYDLGEGLRVKWSFKEAYKDEKDYSLLYMWKDKGIVFEIRVTSSNISEANKILALYNCKIVEKPISITMTADNGEKLEISVKKAKKLGFKVEV